MTARNEKQIAAKSSIAYVKDGMSVGLGSGSTAEFMVEFLAEKVAKGLKIQGVASSENTEKLARRLGIPIITLESSTKLDIYIDGADEIDEDFNMIKGGGGALLREKILAHNSELRIIIVDASKEVKQLGEFKLPIEVIPFAHKQIIHQLDTMNLEPVLRKNGDDVYVTDENNYILDVDIKQQHNYHALNDALLAIPGVVETGLFLDYADILLVGKGNDVIVRKNPRSRSN